MHSETHDDCCQPPCKQACGSSWASTSACSAALVPAVARFPHPTDWDSCQQFGMLSQGLMSVAGRKQSASQDWSLKQQQQQRWQAN